ncbi:MAG: tetratricopeptide repeat protein [Candidatus Eremiobacteraeota bacterium]|nr:tetratricopeptide repeat protein [Candidatus Eremiobacteraeota bacterium]MBV9056124.1 tetratricopeptide repeat protein [Candidatus Eremiobacteraeota bacterium]MBV9699730.1 tetratricopeptide repeat protein [Candidatus Eremiobacteraeota bacterium]
MRRSLFRALPLALLLAFGLGALALAQTQTVILPVEAHAKADQQAAIMYARELIAAGDMDRAIKGLEDFVASHPSAADAARFLGDLYYRQGRFDRAEAIYRALIARDAGDKESHNRLGVVYAAQNHVDEAIAQFESALPGTDSIKDLVFLHRRKGDLTQYESQMIRRANDNPTDADAQEELGEIFGTLHQPNAAIRYFQRALDTQPKSIAALNGAAMAYLDLQQHATAMQYLGTCLALDPFNYACVDNLGVAYIQDGMYGDALDQFRKAHRLEPERPEAIVNFGYLADARGDWKRAVTYYVQAIAVNPYTAESYVNLGIDYEHNNLYPLAEAALLKGVAAAPYDGRIRYLLARAYAAQGQKALAIEELKAAQASLDPEVAEIAKEESARLAGASGP